MRNFWFMLPVGLLLACGGRSMTAADGGASSDSKTKSDAKQPQKDQGSGGLDACVRPPGGCFSPKDCPLGQDCKGCLPDPCCPMCGVCYGKCVASGECWDNGDCAKGKFCKLDGGDCGKTKPGECVAPPAACPDMLNPVCGCDGKTYGNACEAYTAGVSVDKKGLCDKNQCEAINTSYQSAVQGAKKCCAMCDSIQCTNKVKSALDCPCSTYVNSVTSSIASLEKQWTSFGCNFFAWGCPPVPCPQASPDNCVSAAGGGICKD